jgi:cob(I)alamin adenosyltransferase
MRWQVSRLAEQGFIPSIPAFPTLLGAVALGISPVTVAGAAAVQAKSKGFEPYRIPSSPVVGQEPTQAHHLPVAATCQAKGAHPVMSKEDAAADEKAALSGGSLDERHAEKMAKKKAARDRIMATKSADKGLIIVHTGAGKGKSSSAFGMIVRCVAHGFPCAVVQFIKGAWDTGERRLLTGHFGDLCQFHAMGEGFTWETQDRARDIAAARAGWEKAKQLIADPTLRMVVLDEINIALRYDYLDVGEVVDFLTSQKPPMTHVVLTGRNAKQELIDAADLVTEMTLIKHPFRSGIKAQPGVEF